MRSETAGGGDATLENVRALIEQAEAIPAKPLRRRGPARERPERGAGGGQTGGSELVPVLVRPVGTDAQSSGAPWDSHGSRDEGWADETDDPGYRIVKIDEEEAGGGGGLRGMFGRVFSRGGGASGADYEILETGTVEPGGAAPRRRGMIGRIFSRGARQPRDPGYRIVEPGRRGRGGSGPRRGLGGRLFGWIPSLIGRGFAALERQAEALGISGLNRVRNFFRRPDAKWKTALVLLVLFFLFFTAEALLLLFFLVLFVVAVWALVGPDAIEEMVVKWYDRLKARNPEKAEEVRLRAASVSRFLNEWIEKLPDEWTQGLYLPDFEPDGYVSEKAMVDPFEELAAQVQAAKRTGREA
ncbi:MAG: hypothetical protein CSA74_00230 [Rhodobacterales bacterium]|nr:MAG: hypothetical protein CSA74_00230 [Rhodobacterales bacterium]